MAHISESIATTLSTTNEHRDVDLEAQAPPPTYTRSPPSGNIEVQAERPSELSHFNAARSLAITTPPTATPQPRAKKTETGTYLFMLWFFLFFLFTLLLTIHMSTLMNGNPAYPLTFMAFFVVPFILSLIWKKISWYRMSPEQRDRKKRLDDLKKLIEKTKKLNKKGGSGETINAGNGTREMEIVGQLRSWPQDEDWMKLVMEYDQLQSAQAERGWLLRAPPAVPAVGPSSIVEGEMPAVAAGDVK